jgi:hypothetical protein
VETFVIRVFVPTGGERLDLSGVVEHPASGRNLPFRGADGLLDAVRCGLACAKEADVPGTSSALGARSGRGISGHGAAGAAGDLRATTQPSGANDARSLDP